MACKCTGIDKNCFLLKQKRKHSGSQRKYLIFSIRAFIKVHILEQKKNPSSEGRGNSRYIEGEMTTSGEVL